MKFLHLSDLHLGKRLNEFSLIDDQKYILDQILLIADDEKPDGVIIAGDVYDKSVPSAEAVKLCDDFLVSLTWRTDKIFIISGNHDSAERISFGGRIMDKAGVHLSPLYDGNSAPVPMSDEHGTVNVYLLPFLKPSMVKQFAPDAEIASYTDAIRTAIRRMTIDPAQRSIIVTHQFVTGAERSDSEEISVGGSDNVDVSVFDPFDYVALGHIHGPQSISRESVRYCGTPLKYSFSEKDHKKSVTVVELKEKGNVSVRTVPLTPLHDLREIRGPFAKVIDCGRNDTKNDDYVRVVLTDEEDVPDAMQKLRNVYPNVMELAYDNTRTRAESRIDGADTVEKRSEIELLEEFYEQQNGQPMCAEARQFAADLFEMLREGAI